MGTDLRITTDLPIFTVGDYFYAVLVEGRVRVRRLRTHISDFADDFDNQVAVFSAQSGAPSTNGETFNAEYHVRERLGVGGAWRLGL